MRLTSVREGGSEWDSGDTSGPERTVSGKHNGGEKPQLWARQLQARLTEPVIQG